MHVSDAGLRLIEEFEGFSGTPYWDPYGRVWTRGYGETEGIRQGSPRISREQAQARLRALVQDRYEPSIHQLGVELNQNQFDALCSFSWNLGAGIFTGALRQQLTGHSWTAAAHTMLSYDHAGGHVLAGLQRRRRAEVNLFLTPIAPYVPADEARWIREYDQLLKARPGSTTWIKMRRRALRRRMNARILELVHLANDDGGWGKLNRENRYRALLARTKR
jgi:lysozyme